MTEREAAILVISQSVNLRLLRLLNLGEENHNKCENKDSKSDHQCRSSSRNLSCACVADECAHENVNTNCSCRVEHTTNLNQLVASVTTTTEEVKHRVYNCVEHTHAKTRDESTDKVNNEAHRTAEPLDKKTDNTYDQGEKSCFLITKLLDKKTSRDTHKEVSAKVAVVTYLCKGIRNAEVVFQNDSHW